MSRRRFGIASHVPIRLSQHSDRPQLSLADLGRRWPLAAVMRDALTDLQLSFYVTRCYGPIGRFDGVPLLQSHMCRLLDGRDPRHAFHQRSGHVCACVAWYRALSYSDTIAWFPLARTSTGFIPVEFYADVP